MWKASSYPVEVRKRMFFEDVYDFFYIYKIKYKKMIAQCRTI
jgi:hypothetical protein